jgi:hypothetical protein
VNGNGVWRDDDSVERGSDGDGNGNGIEGGMAKMVFWSAKT